MNQLLHLFDNGNFPCENPLFIKIQPNSTISEVITPCFAFVFLPSILAIFSILCLSFLIFYGFVILSPKLAITKLLLTKATFSGIILFSSLIRLILLFFESTLIAETIIGRTAIFVISVTSFASYIRCWHSGIPSSIWLHLIYFLRFIIIIPQIIVITSLAKSDFASFVLFGLEAISVFFLIILFCFVDKFDGNYENFSNQKPVDPDRTRSSLARSVFAHAGHLMSKGYKGTIDYDTFWSLDPRNQPEHLLTKYEKYFKATKITNEKSSLIPWLLIILMKCDWLRISASVILSIIFSLFLITDPLFLQAIIISNENRYPLWVGFTLIAMMLILTCIRFIINARADFYGANVFMNVQTILVNAMYRKMLKLSAHARTKYSGGQIVNLLATDINMIRAVIDTTPMFLNSSLTLIICLVGLYFVIGINVFYGLAVIIFFLPINKYCFKIESSLQKRQMKLKDDRLKLMTDIFSGIKVLKLYAWEESMRALVCENRTNEVHLIKLKLYCNSLIGIAFNAYPILATIASLTGYVIIQKNSLTPEVAFLSLMFFQLMRFSVYAIPALIQQNINAKISFDRVQEFLLEPEVPEIVNTLVPSNENNVVEFQEAVFSWAPIDTIENEIPPVLKSLTFEIREGELIGIVGRVGVGKSSLLSSICGELYQTSGLFYRKTPISIAYVPQEAWIQNLSLRDNILFGKTYDETFYKQTIEVCALKDDLKMFAAGDATEIGERGLNLSGGQKARVALARAVYQNSDLYIMDDTLSAVDSHVGAHIFQNVIGNDGILKNKTRIFALNSIHFLAKCDRIIVLKEGNIVDIGTYVELLARENETFNDLVRELASKSKEQAEVDEAIAEEEDDVLNELVGVAQRLMRTRTTSVCSKDGEQPQTDIGRLVEEVAVGKVSYKMYLSYIKAFGVGLALLYVFTLFFVRTILESSSQIWMAKWSSSSSTHETGFSNTESLGIYGIFSVSSCIVIGIASCIIAFGAYKASTKLYDDLFYSLLRSPMAFFDQTPMGRIMNRVSNDIESIDFVVPQKISFIAKIIADIVFYTASATYVMSQLGLLIIPGVVLSVVVVRFYTFTSVQIRRLTSKSWSCVTSQAQESYVGVTNIRVYGAQSEFSQQMVEKQTITSESKLCEIVSNAWIQVNMDIITAIFSSLFTVGAIYLGHVGTLSAGEVALVASTGTMLRGLIGTIASRMNGLEVCIVAIERVHEYVENEQEAEWISSFPPPKNWPTIGNIIFKDLSLRYRPTTPLVLKNLNLEIKAGEKVGIVGRTGAGKTSLTMALFRMIEPANGTIYIDNIDYRTLGLHELRKALTIIPQDPVLFCGNLRINLDPFNELEDSILWEAIEKAHLKKFVEEFPLKLNHEISEGGGNLSVGQRQLVCLARAILRKKTKILVLDEATAAVDLETDQLIQDSIRSQFNQCTILTIAHRLNTIMDYDKVLVMDAGEIKEYDSPTKLLENKNGLFYSLAIQAKVI